MAYQNTLFEFSVNGIKIMFASLLKLHLLSPGRMDIFFLDAILLRCHLLVLHFF